MIFLDEGIVLGETWQWLDVCWRRCFAWAVSYWHTWSSGAVLRYWLRFPGSVPMLNAYVLYNRVSSPEMNTDPVTEMPSSRNSAMPYREDISYLGFASLRDILSHLPVIEAHSPRWILIISLSWSKGKE